MRIQPTTEGITTAKGARTILCEDLTNLHDLNDAAREEAGATVMAMATGHRNPFALMNSGSIIVHIEIEHRPLAVGDGPSVSLAVIDKAKERVRMTYIDSPSVSKAQYGIPPSQGGPLVLHFLRVDDSDDWTYEKATPPEHD